MSDKLTLVLSDVQIAALSDWLAASTTTLEPCRISREPMSKRLRMTMLMQHMLLSRLALRLSLASIGWRRGDRRMSFPLEICAALLLFWLQYEGDRPMAVQQVIDTIDRALT